MTPLQEFIEVLKINRDTAFEKEKLYEDLVLTEYYEGRAKAFEDAISFAEAYSEKEVSTLMWFAAYVAGELCEKDISLGEMRVLAEGYYNKAFNTKEK